MGLRAGAGRAVAPVPLAEQIDAKIAQLRAAGVIPGRLHREYRAANGDPVTNEDYPGCRQHPKKSGRAADCFWVVKVAPNGPPAHRLVNGLNGYRVMAEEAKRLGLDPGGLWRKFPDWPHVQLRPGPAP